YLAAADQQEQFELKFKADQGLGVDISRVEIYFGACQEIPQQGCDKVEDGHTINFVSTPGCDAVDDSKGIKCDQYETDFPGQSISSGSSWSIFFNATTNSPANLLFIVPGVIYTYIGIDPLELDFSHDIYVLGGDILRSDFFLETFMGNQTIYGIRIENPIMVDESNVVERYTIATFPIDTSPVPVNSQEITLFNTSKANWTRPAELINNEEDANASYTPKQGYMKLDFFNVSLYVYDGENDTLINFTKCYMDFDWDYNLTDNESAKGPPGVIECDDPLLSGKLNVSIAPDGSGLNVTAKFYQEIDNQSLSGRLFEIDTDSDMLWDVLNYEGVCNYSFYDTVN
ncbi:MAG: hypothetical protein JSV63_03255, partial [Candidatus Aenigmatarchaeota archaeon]